MSILIVSANPLFTEVIAATIAPDQPGSIALGPQEALSQIGELHPEVIVIDESLANPEFKQLVCAACSLKQTRLIVVNPLCNEICQIDSHYKTLTKAGDLLAAITNTSPETQLTI